MKEPEKPDFMSMRIAADHMLVVRMIEVAKHGNDDSFIEMLRMLSGHVVMKNEGLYSAVGERFRSIIQTCELRHVPVLTNCYLLAKEWNKVLFRHMIGFEGNAALRAESNE